MHQNANLNVILYWKSSTISDCLLDMEEALNITFQMLNACWKPLWPECVADFMRFDPDEVVMKAVEETLVMPKEVTVKGFSELLEKDIIELLEGHNT